MVDVIITELINEYLKESFPIIRMRLPIKGDNNFKRVIKINKSSIYQVSKSDQRYNAMMVLSTILCKTFHIHPDDTIPILKRHLRFK